MGSVAGDLQHPPNDDFEGFGGPAQEVAVAGALLDGQLRVVPGFHQGLANSTGSLSGTSQNGFSGRSPCISLRPVRRLDLWIRRRTPSRQAGALPRKNGGATSI